MAVFVARMNVLCARVRACICILSCARATRAHMVYGLSSFVMYEMIVRVVDCVYVEIFMASDKVTMHSECIHKKAAQTPSVNWMPTFQFDYNWIHTESFQHLCLPFIQRRLSLVGLRCDSNVFLWLDSVAIRTVANDRDCRQIACEFSNSHIKNVRLLGSAFASIRFWLINLDDARYILVEFPGDIWLFSHAANGPKIKFTFKMPLHSLFSTNSYARSYFNKNCAVCCMFRIPDTGIEYVAQENDGWWTWFQCSQCYIHQNRILKRKKSK